MSTDYPSSNPFRRKGGPTASALSETPSISTINHIAFQQTNPTFETNPFEQVLPKKIVKRVRVQSPPPQSPSIPDSSSTVGEDYSIREKPPTPIPRDTDEGEDPFDSIGTGSVEDETVQVSVQAPANPFSKTLETMEHPDREVSGISTQTITSPGKGSLDVDAFKRLLMTGSSGLDVSTPPVPPAQVTHVLGDSSSGTDASSVSRQSIFDAIQDTHGESPRTSHEISEPEDDRRGGDITSTAGRKKPPPPSSRHGKLIKVELRDDPATIPVQSPNTPGSITSQNYFSSSPLSQTDLNKPLPPAPNRASHDSDRESIFDKESAGKIPDPPSPPTSLRRKTPPAPPITRRHSQLVYESKLTRESGRLSPKAEEETPNLREETGRPRADSARAPPPPPVRRAGSIRGKSHQTPVLNSPSSISLPPPPPTRGASRHSSAGRPPSLKSIEISHQPNKRTSTIAPPPPPPRHGRSSMDGSSPGTSQRPSGEMRRSIDGARRGSEASSLSYVERVDEISPPLAGHDVLADLNALQREIDALRGGDREKTTT